MLCEKFKSAKELKVKTHSNVFPNISDREFWDKARDRFAGMFEDNAKEYEKDARKPLTASLYRQFAINGNRSNYESIYFLRRMELVNRTILECFYNDGSQMNDILDLTWMILEETSWTLPAHNREVDEADSLPDYKKHSLDLFLAETACVMAFVYRTVGEKLEELSRVVTRRIKETVERVVFDDYLERSDYWWMGFTERIPNNWNPWINSNVLASALILEDDKDKLAQIVYKVMRTLDRYLKEYPDDGACDEGPSYWNQAGLSMLECLWLLDMVTDSQVNIFSEEKVINTSEYFMKVYTGLGECVNFADSGAKVPIYYASLYKFGKILNNENLIAFAKHLYDTRSQYGITKKREIITKSIRMMDLITYSMELENLESAEFEPDLDYYFESTEVMTSKANINPRKGLFLAAKGGHNDESHNHNDIGNFIVYKNGTKFLVDSGNMTYSKITFSDERYTLWTTRSAYHNLPVIDGKEQKAGRDYKSKNAEYSKSGAAVLFSLDIKDAYENRDDINKWVRSIEYNKDLQEISVTEDFEFLKEYDYELCFLTPHKTERKENKIIFTSENGETLSMSFSGGDFDFAAEMIAIDDALLLSNWGDKLYRVRIKSRAKSGKISYIIK